MKVLGLTGGTGSGKSVVSRCLSRHNAYIIDADKIARQVVEKDKPAYNVIVEYFGTQILDEDRNIIRHELGDIVFNNRKKLIYLNRCTHKYINMEIMDQIKYAKANPKKYSIVVLDAPLLIEAGLVDICDSIWVVFAKDEERLRRIMERDKITKEQAQSRLESQLKWEVYESHATDVIDNSGSLEDVERQVSERIELLLNEQ